MRDNGGVSDTQNPPETPEPISAAGVGGNGVRPPAAGGGTGTGAAAGGERVEPVETEVTSDAVMVRRAPRYGRFIALGAILGAIVALILTFVFDGQAPENELMQFDKGQVFGFLLLICGAVGVAVGAAVALVIDRTLGRRSEAGIAEHESTHHVDE